MRMMMKSNGRINSNDCISVVVLEESPCPWRSSKTNLQVLVLNCPWISTPCLCQSYWNFSRTSHSANCPLCMIMWRPHEEGPRKGCPNIARSTFPRTWHRARRAFPPAVDINNIKFITAFNRPRHVPADTIHPTHQLLVRDAHSAAESVLPSSACACHLRSHASRPHQQHS